MDTMPAKYTDMIAANIRAERARIRIKQADVVTRMNDLGFTTWYRQTVARVELGKRHVLAEELFGLAQALETTVPRILGLG